MPNQMYQLCYGSYTIVGMLWQQQLFYGSNSHAMTAAIAHMAAPSMLYQQQLCYGNRSSNYAMAVTAMLWQQQLCYRSNNCYAMAAAVILWSGSSYAMTAKLCYVSYAMSAMPWHALFLLKRWLWSKNYNKTMMSMTRWWQRVCKCQRFSKIWPNFCPV